MSEAKFTPAPWAVVTNSAGGLEVVKQRVRDKGEEWIPITYDATVAMGIGDHTDEETNGNELANAHLIAAAPEMYEYLSHMVEREVISDPSIEREVKSLLAKARGEHD